MPSLTVYIVDKTLMNDLTTNTSQLTLSSMLNVIVCMYFYVRYIIVTFLRKKKTNQHVIFQLLLITLCDMSRCCRFNSIGFDGIFATLIVSIKILVQVERKKKKKFKLWNTNHRWLSISWGMLKEWRKKTTSIKTFTLSNLFIYR